MGLRSLLSPVRRQEKRTQAAQRRSLHARAELERRKQREREKCGCGGPAPATPKRKASTSRKPAAKPKRPPAAAWHVQPDGSWKQGGDSRGQGRATPPQGATKRAAAAKPARKRVTLPAKPRAAGGRGVSVRAAAPAAPARPALVPLARAQGAARELSKGGGGFTEDQMYAAVGVRDTTMLPRLLASGKVRRTRTGGYTFA